MGDETAAEVAPEVKVGKLEKARMDPAAERAMLTAAMKRHSESAVRACLEEVQAALDKHGCELVGTPLLHEGMIVASVGCRLKAR